LLQLLQVVAVCCCSVLLQCVVEVCCCSVLLKLLQVVAVVAVCCCSVLLQLLQVVAVVKVVKVVAVCCCSVLLQCVVAVCCFWKKIQVDLCDRNPITNPSTFATTHTFHQYHIVAASTKQYLGQY
jgi:hypothetical protein